MDNSYDPLKNLFDLQNKIEVAFNPSLFENKYLMDTFQSVDKIQKSSGILSTSILTVADCFKDRLQSVDFTQKVIDNIGSAICKATQNSILEQISLLEKMLSFAPDKCMNCVSPESLSESSKIVAEANDDLSEFEFPPEIETLKNSASSALEKNRFLTIDQWLGIISIIISILLYVLGQQSSSHDQKIESQMQKLIELETREVDLLEQLIQQSK